MSGTLTGMPSVDELIRQLVGKDGGDGGEWADVTALDSLDPSRVDAVDTPASGLPWLVMKRGGQPRARGGAAVAGLVVKSDGERRYTLACVYPSDRPDRARAMDGFRDFAPAGALQDAAWNFLRKGGSCGLMHRDGTTGAGEVVESYLWPGDDWTLTAADGSTQTIRKGDWMAGIIWSPPAWAAIKRGELTGVSMQGGAKRRQPTAEELAGLRKAAGKVPRCGKCQKKARTAGAKFCAKCGTSLSVAKSAAVLKAEAERESLAKSVAIEAAHQAARAEDWAGWLLKRALSGDPAARGNALCRIDSEFGVGTALRLLSGELTPQVIGSRVAKSAAVAGMSRCRTCKGSGRLRHPSTGKPSRNCPSCQGSGQWSPDGDNADMTPEDAKLFDDYAGKARAGGAGAPEALGKLVELVGAEVAMKVVAGGEISPAEFQRGYISACRAGQSAAPGQEPRIPQSTHVAEASDFRRGPLAVRQSRPAPGSTWPGPGGQQDYYGAGPGARQGQAPWRAPSPAQTWPTPALASSARG